MLKREAPRIDVIAKQGVMVPDRMGGYFSVERPTNVVHDRYIRRRLRDESLSIYVPPKAPPATPKPPKPPNPPKKNASRRRQRS